MPAIPIQLVYLWEQTELIFHKGIYASHARISSSSFDQFSGVGRDDCFYYPISSIEYEIIQSNLREIHFCFGSVSFLTNKITGTRYLQLENKVDTVLLTKFVTEIDAPKLKRLHNDRLYVYGLRSEETNSTKTFFVAEWLPISQCVTLGKNILGLPDSWTEQFVCQTVTTKGQMVWRFVRKMQRQHQIYPIVTVSSSEIRVLVRNDDLFRFNKYCDKIFAGISYGQISGVHYSKCYHRVKRSTSMVTKKINFQIMESIIHLSLETRFKLLQKILEQLS